MIRGPKWVPEVGMGYNNNATRHWGIRFDVRDHMMQNRLDTFIDATPNVATLAPGDVIEGGPGGTNPNLQFSADGTNPSSLGGAAIHHQRTFKGDGWFNQINASGGLFYRF